MNTNLKNLKVCGLEVQTVKKDIKNMHLGVYPPEGRVRVAAPMKMSDESIRLFVISLFYTYIIRYLKLKNFKLKTEIFENLKKLLTQTQFQNSL